MAKNRVSLVLLLFFVSSIGAMDKYILDTELKETIDRYIANHDWLSVASLIESPKYNYRKQDIAEYLTHQNQKVLSQASPLSWDDDYGHSFYNLIKNYQEEYPGLITVYNRFKQEMFIEATHQVKQRCDTVPLTPEDKKVIDKYICRIFPLPFTVNPADGTWRGYQLRNVNWNDLIAMIHGSTRRRQEEIGQYLASCATWNWFGASIFAQNGRDQINLFSQIEANSPQLVVIQQIFRQKNINANAPSHTIAFISTRIGWQNIVILTEIGILCLAGYIYYRFTRTDDDKESHSEEAEQPDTEDTVD